MTKSNVIYDKDHRRRAKFLYWQGFSCVAISQELNINVNTIYAWKLRDKWDETLPIDKVNGGLEARLMQLITKDKKDESDFRELDKLGVLLERLARISRYKETGSEVVLNPKIASRYKAARKKPNELTPEQIKKLNNEFFKQIYPHQRDWYEAGLKYRIRNILKSRQIGATNFFSYEALIDAINTGRNQIFLSASKAQAFQFRQYIKKFGLCADVEFKGVDKIVLPHNSAELIFLSTNKSTSQSYNGNLYLDEYFWINQFNEFKRVVSAMASQKNRRLTYFSTPSSVTHEAYAFWTGAAFNKGKSKKEQVKIDTSHERLKDGFYCADGQYRQIITIDDAERRGFDLFDIEQLRREYSAEDFDNLFMCKFIDDTFSVFPLQDLKGCMVDSWLEWTDYKPEGARPLGERSVWIGYDPSDVGDSAGCVVVSPPNTAGGKFRVIERHQFRGMDFSAQANYIKQLCERYNVTYIGIDATGLGVGVYQLVQQFFPAVQAFKYSIELKQQLIFKMQDVIRKRRLEFDTGARDLVSSLMSIRRVLTSSGTRTTYRTNRNEESSHGDLAWALMHAIANEPLASDNGLQAKAGFIDIF